MSSLREKAVETLVVNQLVGAIYPILIPVEQQDCAIQARNHALMAKLATELWHSFLASED